MRRTSRKRSCRSSRARTFATHRPTRSAPKWRSHERAIPRVESGAVRSQRSGDSGHRGRPCMKPTILVVEDEPAIVELLNVNLMDAGYEVREAPDAETAQRALNDALPDLVLLDWMRP